MDLAALLPTLGPAGIVSLTVGLVLLGRIVPRSFVRELTVVWDARLAESKAHADQWHAAFLAMAEAQRLTVGQVDELLDVARAGGKALEAVAAHDQDRAS